MTTAVELGIDTFGDVTVDDNGRRVLMHQVISQVVEQGVLADEVGVHAIGLGEHHRDDFAISAPEVVLGAIAGCTSRIRLTTAVTVLSTDDPVRVFERFSTLDAVSRGRAEVIVGRGSFTESFGLFGFDLTRYDELFEDRLDLFRRLLDQQPVTWTGSTRAPLIEQLVYPPTASGRLPTWVGVGGSPESVVRAARHGLPLMLAVIGGEHRRFAPLVELFHRATSQLGGPPLPVGCHSPGHVADSDQQARDQAWEAYAVMHRRIAAERGWGAMTRTMFDAQCGPRGALCVGAPDTVARKIADAAMALGLTRFHLKVGSGPMPHRVQMRAIELYGQEVIPMVHELLAHADQS